MTNDKNIHDLVQMIDPEAPIISVSHPEPALRRHNVVATYATQEESRNAVLALESFEDDDAAIGLVALGHEDRPSGIQPQDSAITGSTMRRAGKGAAIGAVVTALVIGGAAVLIDPSGIAVGAAAGGALFGAFVGGVWGAFVRFGGSDAYRQSFVENDRGVTLVSFHTGDESSARKAQDLLSLESMSPAVHFGRDGDRVWECDVSELSDHSEPSGDDSDG